MIGKIVTVVVDRPLGTFHPTHKDILYTVNYGYVPGVFANDGEEQDAYVLGVDKPIEQFVGKVVAIIHRLDDVEDKWVVAPQESTLTKEEILKQVHFQERFFTVEVEM
ncbi:MAG: inorganic pyrophosphatase [Clostridia bacterium]|nr:inorganic pyrophosphatase [Clostridia bacterium]